MDVKKIAEGLHPLERKVLPLLNKISDFDELIKASKLKDVEVMRALQWLQNKDIIKIESKAKELIELDDNGKIYLENGLPEKRFLKAIENRGLRLNDIEKKANLNKDEIGVCIGALKEKAGIDMKDGVVSITEQGKKLLEKESLEERFLKMNFPVDISGLKEEERFAFDNLKKRRKILTIKLKKIKKAVLSSLGKKLIKEKISGNFIDRIIPEMLKKGRWKNKKFRRYDVIINVPKISGGKRHFSNQAIDYMKQIWLELGFKEMAGGSVQTSFWDLDALFVPQDHPARELQDTFYIKEPRYGKLPKIAEKIRAVHENGGNTGSKGWQYKWSEETAKENLLRTHTTVLSAKTINNLKKEDLPAKFFSVAKVYRNEALDWKHLFEFYQVEGIVIDPNANFKNLKGYLKEFFKKMGFDDVRIRPAHFPYTEPSAEVEVLHPIKKEWVELGGAGIFRPELVKPLLGIDVPVLAWGLGMERIIVDYYGFKDLRMLYNNDIKQLKEAKVFMK